MEDYLARLGSRLVECAAASVLSIQRCSNFPLYLLWDDRLERNEVQMNWTSTSLGVLHVGTVAADPAIVEAKAVARVLGLEQKVLGLPISSDDPDEQQRAAASSCLETVGLLRTWAAYRNAMGADPRILNEFLPMVAQQVAVGFCRALDEGNEAAMQHPLMRQGAMLVSAGIIKESYAADTNKQYPELPSVIAEAITSSPREAATSCWTWISQGRPVPTWQNITGRTPARVARAKVQPLQAPIDGVLASDSVNLKGFALTTEELAACLEFTRAKPFMYFDHDRSRPPALVTLDAHWVCENGNHQIHVKVAAIDADAHRRLQTNGGFSVGFSRQKETH